MTEPLKQEVEVAVAAESAAAYDVEVLRGDFPGLHQEAYGRPLVYLDNAATTQKPGAVIDAVAGFYERDSANVHRGVHLLSQRATEGYEAARKTVAGFLGAASEREIVFTRGATEAINLVAHSFLRPRLSAGDEVLVTAMEHHANIVPWQLVCEQAGAHLRVAPMDDRGALILEEYEALLSPRTKIAALSHVSNALGTVNPVETLIELAHARGIPVLLDGAQAVLHREVDVQALGCEFFVFSGHKIYGPTGIGALYGRLDLLEEMPPYQGGGDMILNVTFEGTTFNRPPTRFEAGTPHIAGALGLAAALDYLSGIGLAAVAAHEDRLLAHATEAVGALPGIRLVGTAPDKASVLSFTVEGVHPHDIGTIVDRRGIAIRAGHHCAQPVMAHFGVPATARASFALYNTHPEVDALVEALGEVLEMFA